MIVPTLASSVSGLIDQRRREESEREHGLKSSASPLSLSSNRGTLPRHRAPWSVSFASCATVLRSLGSALDLFRFFIADPHFARLDQAANNRWTARKGGSFVARDALSFEQQQILAAVPVRSPLHLASRPDSAETYGALVRSQRWKQEWVRPSNLQPGQNPNYKSADATLSFLSRSRVSLTRGSDSRQYSNGSLIPRPTSLRVLLKRWRPRSNK